MPDNDHTSHPQFVRCGIVSLEDIEKASLLLSFFYLVVIGARQLYHSSTKQATDAHVLPLHFRFFSVSLFAVAFFSASVLHYDNEMLLPYSISALTQAFNAGVSMVVALFLAQDSAGSRAIRNSIIGGGLFAAEKFTFVFVVVQYGLDPRKQMQLKNQKAMSIAWMLQDGSQAFAFALVLIYAMRNRRPRPGVVLCCSYQIFVFCSFVVQGILYYNQ
jgi:hypothetical protein